MKSTPYTQAYRDRRRAAGLPGNPPAQQAQINRWLAETYRRRRAEVLAMLGDCCAWCGHEDLAVLELDHIADDGADDRRRFQAARSMLSYYAKHPDEARARLQLLCRNCNWRKRKGLRKWGGPTAKSGGRILDGRTWDEMPNQDVPEV